MGAGQGVQVHNRYDEHDTSRKLYHRMEEAQLHRAVWIAAVFLHGIFRKRIPQMAREGCRDNRYASAVTWMHSSEREGCSLAVQECTDEDEGRYLLRGKIGLADIDKEGAR